MSLGFRGRVWAGDRSLASPVLTQKSWPQTTHSTTCYLGSWLKCRFLPPPNSPAQGSDSVGCG